MYKWHVHSAIGRGRPVANDISRVADGIAASLRQFSISLSRSAEDDGNDAPPPSRSQRSAEAYTEARSLAPKPSRGIDARSLAAKPPPAFTIRRIDETPERGGSFRGVSYIGRGGSEGGRGGARGVGGFGGRGRGGRGSRARGRGGRVSRGRGKGTAAKKPPRQRNQEDDGPEDPLTEEEKAYIYNHECGFPHAYQPTTSAESLARLGGATVSSPRGVNETLMYKMQTATGVGPEFSHAGRHLHNMSAGNGLAIFEDPEQRLIAQKWKKGPGQIGSLAEKDKKDLLNAWVGGQYEAPVAQKAGVLGQVETFLRRNETYLPEDVRKLEGKLKTLLPTAAPATQQQGKARATA